MTKEQFSKWLDKAEYDEYIIFIRAKHSENDEWEDFHEYLYYDSQYDMWVWENDWHEGQEFVDYYGQIKLSEMTEYYVL